MIREGSHKIIGSVSKKQVRAASEIWGTYV